MKRRDFLSAVSTGTALVSVSGWASVPGTVKPHVLVVGGGYGGASAARYIRMWSEGGINVTIVEPDAQFVSCPLSNLVLGGSRRIADLTMPREGLASRYGIRIIRDSVASIDAQKRTARLAGGQVLSFDRAILSPGVELLWDGMPGMAKAGAHEAVLHAWKAGPQTVALRAQLEAMPDGGVFALTVPPAPYRCPPGPYERACQVAHYFKQAKPRSKVLILDANDDVVSKGALFKRIWAERYPGMIEYRPNFTTVDVDAGAHTAISELGDRVRADVLNVVPPQRAGKIATETGLASANKRWCEVNFLSYESTQAKNIHVLGDAIQVAPMMPKSAHMANQHAKVCAAAVVEMLNGREPFSMPVVTNTCYSFVSDKDVIHVASVHAYDFWKKTMIAVAVSGGVSTAASELEGVYALNWARNIWSDTLALDA